MSQPSSTIAPLRGAAVLLCLMLVLAAAPLSAAAPAEMLRYKLACSLDEERSSVECEAEVWVRLLRDSLPAVHWTFPAAATIISIQDEARNKISREVHEAARGEHWYDVECRIPPDLSVNDSVLFRIRYTVAADTSGAGEVFINPKEFLLQCGPRFGWVPFVSSAGGARVPPRTPIVLEVLVPSQFTLLSGGTIDSLYANDGNTVWKVVRSDARGWEESFCLAGSKEVQPLTASGGKGRCAVTLYTSPSKFQPHFASSLSRMLGAASEYFSSQSYRPQFDRLTFGCIGTRAVGMRPVRSGNLVILRNAPQFAVFDSSVFTGTAHNVWLQETARVYAFGVPDSAYWFNESWAGYLATRFLFAAADTTEALREPELSQLLAHALDFFPTYPIAAGRTSRLNEDAVFLYKGRYVFLMLENILGRTAFDGVMRELYARSAAAAPSIGAMQSLCEAAYGSSLSWFFEQWLYRTGFPEYVLSSQIVSTPRGMYDVSVTVTQRGELFAMPLTLAFESAGKTAVKRIFMKEEQQRFTYIFPWMPAKIDWHQQYVVLRWIPRYRILAHARTSLSFRVFNRDLASSEREAQLTLQLDPDNNVGANSIALFSLGKSAGAVKDWPKAADYFLRASQQREPEGYAYVPLLSVVRHANVLDLLGERDQAVAEYGRALDTAMKNPLLYGPVISEARRFLVQPFEPAEDVWYEYY